MDREKVIKWLEYDYFPRVGAYRKDCKQGCDACMSAHDSDDYCDIDMLCKVLDLLKEQEPIMIKTVKINGSGRNGRCQNCLMMLNETDYPNFCGNCGQAVKWNG